MFQKANESVSPIGLAGPQVAGPLTGGLTVLSVVAGYYALAVIGTVLSLPPSGFAIVWPATAFLISVLLLTDAVEKVGGESGWALAAGLIWEVKG